MFFRLVVSPSTALWAVVRESILREINDSLLATQILFTVVITRSLFPIYILFIVSRLI